MVLPSYHVTTQKTSTWASTWLLLLNWIMTDASRTGSLNCIVRLTVSLPFLTNYLLSPSCDLVSLWSYAVVALTRSQGWRWPPRSSALLLPAVVLRWLSGRTPGARRQASPPEEVTTHWETSPQQFVTSQPVPKGNFKITLPFASL